MRNRELNRDQNLIGGQMAVQNWTEINAWTALVRHNLRLNYIQIQIWPVFRVERQCNAPLECTNIDDVFCMK